MGRYFSAAERKMIMQYKRRFRIYSAARRALVTDGVQISISGMKKIWAQFKKHRHYRTARKSGRPRKTSRRQDVHLHQLALADRKTPYTQVARAFRIRTRKNVSRHLVANRLKERGYHRRRAVRRPLATRQHLQQRLAYAREHPDKRPLFWHRMKFSDEKIFSNQSDGHAVNITRKVGEKYKAGCVIPTKKWGPRVHVWGIISWEGVGPLRRIVGNLTAHRYITEVIFDIRELCTIRRNGQVLRYLFQQDNARPHSAALTQQFLDEQHVRCIDWPPNSPDLNPIEHVWSHVAARVRSRGVARDAQQLWNWVQSEWDRTPIDYIRSLYRSIPSRLQEVIDNRGGYGHY